MSSTTIRTIACSATVAVAALAGPTVAAQAAAPATPAAPSVKRAPNAAALRAVGVKVTWPLSSATPSVFAGTKLSVRVRTVRGKKHPALVHLAFVRTDARGHKTKLVEGAVLRAGLFSVRVPKAPGRRYALTLKAGKVRYTSRFTTTVISSHDTVPPAGPLPATPAPAPVPTPMPVAPGPCGATPAPNPAAGTTTASGVLHLGVTSVVAGQSVPYAIENTGTVCLTFGLGYGWERLDGGTWTPVGQDAPLPVPSIAFTVAPGATWTGESWNWGPIAAQTGATFVPGHYRLSVGANWDNAQRADAVTMSAELDVTAPPADQTAPAAG